MIDSIKFIKFVFIKLAKYLGSNDNMLSKLSL